MLNFTLKNTEIRAVAEELVREQDRTIFFFDVEKYKQKKKETPGQVQHELHSLTNYQFPKILGRRGYIESAVLFWPRPKFKSKIFFQEPIESGRRVPKHSTVMQYCQNFQRHVFSRPSFRRTQITVNRKWNLHIIQMIQGSLHFNTRLKITGGRKRLDRLCS